MCRSNERGNAGFGAESEVNLVFQAVFHVEHLSAAEVDEQNSEIGL